MPDAPDLDSPKRSPWSSGFPATIGPVLLTLALGNMLRGGTSLIVGCVFLVGGLVVAVMSIRSQRRRARAAGSVPAPLGRQVLVLGLTVVIGGLVYFGLLTLLDRT